MTDIRQPILEMKGISKRFPGVNALSDVNLTVFPGECLGLVGENGAGKSTLMKVLSGVYTPDDGELILDGQTVSLSSPSQAQHLGISIIYQEFNLMPNLTVEENVFIGREPTKRGFVQRKELRRRTQELLDRLHVNLDPASIVRTLSVAQQQMVEIAKALSTNARIVIMDEPTSALTDTEVSALVEIIKGLKADGLGVIFITHRLEEVFAISDRITVLRDGQNANDFITAQTDAPSIVQSMVGRKLSELYAKEETTATDRVVLEVRGLNRTASAAESTKVQLYDIGLKVHAGEIVGLAGLVGSGRTELARSIFGADPIESGEILIDGELATIKSPRDAISRGVGLVPEDRKQQALVLQRAVRENISIAKLGDLSTAGFVHLNAEKTMANYFVDQMRIRTPGLEQKVINLSGGNQQKVVMSRWLAMEPKILIVDEPTRGVDVGAKAEIHRLLAEFAARGVAILMISSELPEILAMSDRVIVMREGRVAGELARFEATQEKIMNLATGVATQNGEAA